MMNHCSAHLVFHVTATSEAMAYNKVFALCLEIMRRSQQIGPGELPATWVRPSYAFRHSYVKDNIGRHWVIYPTPAEEGVMMPYEVETDAKFTKGNPGWSGTEEALSDVARVFEIVTLPDVQFVSVSESIIHWGA